MIREFVRFFRLSRDARYRPSRRTRFRTELERLEDRLTPSLVVVDTTTSHQVWEGFGSYINSYVYEPGVGDVLTPSQRARAIDAAYGQVGLTMGNVTGIFESPGGFGDSRNDDDDPFNFNWAGFNVRPTELVKERVLDLAPPSLNNYYAGATVNLRWRDTWMRAIRSADYDRYLDEAAEQVAANVHYWYAAFGTEPRYNMLFNEALTGNGELFGGTPQEVVDLVKRAGARLRAEGFGETMFVVPGEETEDGSLSLAARILADPDARQYVGAIAYHTYPYGSPYSSIARILATSGQGNPVPDRVAVRNQLRELGQTYGVPVWLTENSNASTTPFSFDALRGRAIHIHDEMVYADASAYFGMHSFWDRTSHRLHFGSDATFFQSEGAIALVDTDGDEVYVTGMGYAIGHYGRWVRPGATRVGAASDDPLLQVTAFWDDGGQQLTLVLINNAADADEATIDLQGFGGGPLTFYGEQSTEAAYWSWLEPFSIEGTAFPLTLPPRSVTTIATWVGAGPGFGAHQPPSRQAAQATSLVPLDLTWVTSVISQDGLPTRRPGEEVHFLRGTMPPPSHTLLVRSQVGRDVGQEGVVQRNGSSSLPLTAGALRAAVVEVVFEGADPSCGWPFVQG